MKNSSISIGILIFITLNAFDVEARELNCKSLSEMIDAKSLGSDREKFKSYYGIQPSDLKDEDFKIIENEIKRCGAASSGEYYGRWNKKYIERFIPEMIESLREVAKRDSEDAREKEQAGAWLGEIEKFDGLIDANPSSPLDEKAIERLNQIEKEAGFHFKDVGDKAATVVRRSEAVRNKILAEAAEKERQNVQSSPYDDYLYQIFFLYSVAEFCLENDSAFSSIEISALNTGIKNITLHSRLPKDQRDRLWDAAQNQSKAARQMLTDKDCFDARTQLGLILPGAFALPASRQNPF